MGMPSIGKPTPAPPPAPDPVAMSQAQGAANKDTAIAQARLNAVDSNSPFGSVSYTESMGPDGTPKFTQNTVLSPDQQRLYNTQQGVTQKAFDTAGAGINNAAQVLSTPFNLNGLPALQTGVNGVPAPNFGIAPSGPIQTGMGPSGPIQTSLNTNGLPALPGANDFSAERKSVEDAYLGRFNEDIGRNEEATISRLNAEGLQRGSEAYGTATNQIDRQRNDARNLAIQAGGAEQSRLFGLASQARGQMFGERQAGGAFNNAAQSQGFSQDAARMAAANTAQGQQYSQNASERDAFNAAQAQQFAQALQGAGFNNQGRQQAISEQQLLRSQPINEIATLLGLGSGVQAPAAAPNFGINVGNTDVLGAYGLQQQSLQNAYNQKMQANNAMWGALGNMAGAAGSAAIMSACDARVKNIARRVGQTSGGIPLYLFAYKDKPDIPIVGPMAQDVRKVHPLAVHNIGGVLHVDMREVA